MTGSRQRHIVLAVALVAIACTVKQEAPKVPLSQATAADSARRVASAHALLGPAARAALDSGNALYRKKAYAAALAQYRVASALAPQHAAPYFGIYMVGRATRDSAMADSALAAIRVRNGPMPTAPHSVNDSVLQRIHEQLRRKASAG
jgi:hypothetical protein